METWLLTCIQLLCTFIIIVFKLTVFLLSLSLQSFMYGDYIAYYFWLGKVYDLTNHIILKLSNGAR